METGKIDMGGIRNLILDLGRVVLELDVEATIQAFVDLGFPRLENAHIIQSRYPFFHAFEKGEIDPDAFIGHVLDAAESDCSREEVLGAWNAMSLGYLEDTVKILLDLRKRYRLLLLSNTNAIHEVYYNRQLAEQHGIENLNRIFEKIYYSHKMGMRKPDPAIFEYVLQDAGLIAGETVFVDDLEENVRAAEALGIRGFHLKPPMRLTEVL